MTYAIAHRGFSSDYDENTLESLNAALAAGANMVEFDVQKTSDDVLILMHDTSVDRTTNGTGNVADLTWSYISGLLTTSGYSVPRLQDVFGAFYGGPVFLFIEIKGATDLAVDIRTLADNYPLIDRQLKFMSFVLSQATSCKTQFPDSDCGMTTGTFSNITGNGLDIWVRYPYTAATAQNVTDAHAAGKQIIGFTYPDYTTGLAGFNLGLDGLGMDNTDDLIQAATDAGVELEYPPTSGGFGMFLPQGVLQQQLVGGLTTYVYDTFTESSNTNLSLHTPDIDTSGAGWDDPATNCVVYATGDYVAIPGDSGIISQRLNSTVTNSIVEADINFRAGGSDEEKTGLWLRSDEGAPFTGWLVNVTLSDTANPVFNIHEYDAGYLLRDSVTMTGEGNFNGDTWHMKAWSDANNVYGEIVVNSTTYSVSYASTTGNTSTDTGIRACGGSRFDNFIVTA